MARSAAGLALALAALLLAVAPGRAHANGVPVKVVLAYREGVSNWGPRGAAGVADVRVGEAYIKVTAAGMQRLDGQLYEGWLINTRTGDRFKVGRFNAEEDGAVNYEQRFESIPDKQYDLFLVSVVPADRETSEPTQQVSIAGYFPKLQPADPSQRPAELPYTGPEPAPPPAAPVAPAPLGLAFAAGAVLGFVGRSLLGKRGGAR